MKKTISILSNLPIFRTRFNLFFILLLVSACFMFSCSQSSSKQSYQAYNLTSQSRYDSLVSDGKVTYFRAGCDILRWEVGKNCPETILERVYFTNEGSYLALANDDLYYNIPLGDDYLYRWDSESGKVEKIAKVWDWSHSFPAYFSGQFWIEDGRIYCLTASTKILSGERDSWEIQVLDLEGEWLQTIPLPDDLYSPVLAYGDYFFYDCLDVSACERRNYALNLKNGETYWLEKVDNMAICTVLEGHLLVEAEDGLYLLDTDGNLTSYTITPEWETGDEECQYYSYRNHGVPYYWDIVVVEARNGESREILTYDEEMSQMVRKGVFYFRTDNWFALLDSRLHMVDLTGGWADYVAEANEARKYPETGKESCFALMPNGTLYLLWVGLEAGWCSWQDLPE